MSPWTNGTGSTAIWRADSSTLGTGHRREMWEKTMEHGAGKEEDYRVFKSGRKKRKRDGRERRKRGVTGGKK